MDSTVYQPYDLEAEIATFFARASASRTECDGKARHLLGVADVAPAAIQDVAGYGYTVHAAAGGSAPAGHVESTLVQFRLLSEALKTEETAALARRVYGDVVPVVTFEGQVGGVDGAEGDAGRAEDGGAKEPVSVFVVRRRPGVLYLEFILAHEMNLPQGEIWRMNLMQDLARLFSKSWIRPQPVDPGRLAQLREDYTRDLNRLLASLPGRFRPSVEASLAAMDDIFSLPPVLANPDLGPYNLVVDSDDCRLVGIQGWPSDTAVLPFGTNLHTIWHLASHFNTRAGIAAYADHDALHDVLWRVFRDEVVRGGGGAVSDAAVGAIKAARVLGLLLAYGFTRPADGKGERAPVGDDEQGRYMVAYLDGLLINPSTRFL